MNWLNPSLSQESPSVLLVFNWCKICFNGKQFWCSQKLTGRLVGQPNRWYQGNWASWAAAVLPGQGGHSFYHTNHKTTSTTQTPNAFASNTKFILEIGFWSQRMKIAEWTTYLSTLAVHRGYRQGWNKFFLLKQNKISLTSQEFQMASLYLLLDIRITLQDQELVETFYFRRKF